MPEIGTIERNQLSVDVRVTGGVEARQVANILAALDRSFSRFAREEYGLRGARLRIEQTGTGSWWALLTAAKEFHDFAQEYPDLLPIFAQNIDVTLKASVLMDQEPKQTAKYARDLLQDLAKAGRRIGAEAIEITSITKIIIVAAYYDMLENPVAVKDPSDGTSVEAVGPRAPMLTDRTAVLRAAELAQNADLIGTIFQVAGDWYVRAEGMFGVLIPLHLSVQAKLAAIDGQVYKIEGALLQSPHGHPIGVEVRQMHFLT